MEVILVARNATYLQGALGRNSCNHAQSDLRNEVPKKRCREMLRRVQDRGDVDEETSHKQGMRRMRCLQAGRRAKRCSNV